MRDGPRLVMLADDLTGALDSACAFAVRGMTTRVVLTPAAFAAALAPGGPEVVALTTGSREMDPEAARAALRAPLAALRGFGGIVMKKIDSRLKGPVAAELAEVRAAFPRPAVVAPAVPALGRVVRGGAVTGAGVPAPLPVAPVLGFDAGVPDTETEAEMDALVPDDPCAVLFVGAAGLSAALARRLGPEGRAPSPALARPLLIAIGSRDPVTLAQIAAAPMAAVPAPGGVVSELPAGGDVLVRIVDGAVPVAPDAAARRFAAGIARALDRRGGAGSLLACGGETAQAILRERGTEALDVTGEVLPGVPVATCSGRALTLLTKSGGFGAPDLFARLVREIDKCADFGLTSR